MTVRRILLSLVLLPASLPAQTPADWEGHWAGRLDGSQETVPVGLSLTHGSDGVWSATLTLPEANRFAQPLGEARIQDDALELPAMGLKLQRTGDRLVGDFPRPGSRLTLARVATLPTAPPPPPAYPNGPGPLWQVRLGGQLFASPATDEAIAVFAGTSGVVTALDPMTGMARWNAAIGAAVYAEPTLDPQAVYVAADDGVLYKLARADGRVLWRYVLLDAPAPRVLPHPGVSAWDWHGPRPVLAGARVLVTAADGSVHSVDALSGERLWRAAVGAPMRQGVAVADGRVFYGADDGRVGALSLADGAALWQVQTGALVDTRPVPAAGRVLVGNRGAGLFALSAADGRELWRLSFWGSWVESTPVVHHGVAYIGASDLGRISAVDLADGRVRWRQDVHGWSWGTPLVLDDRIVVGTAAGEPYPVRHHAGVVMLDRQDGKVRWRWPLPDSGGLQWGVAGSPKAAGDVVVLATIQGGVFAFRLDDRDTHEGGARD